MMENAINTLFLFANTSFKTTILQIVRDKAEKILMRHIFLIRGISQNYYKAAKVVRKNMRVILPQNDYQNSCH